MSSVKNFIFGLMVALTFWKIEYACSRVNTKAVGTSNSEEVDDDSRSVEYTKSNKSRETGTYSSVQYVGIGVGVPAAALLLLFVAVCFLPDKSRKQRNHTPEAIQLVLISQTTNGQIQYQENSL